MQVKLSVPEIVVVGGVLSTVTITVSVAEQPVKLFVTVKVYVRLLLPLRLSKLLVQMLRYLLMQNFVKVQQTKFLLVQIILVVIFGQVGQVQVSMQHISLTNQVLIP